MVLNAHRRGDRPLEDQGLPADGRPARPRHQLTPPPLTAWQAQRIANADPSEVRTGFISGADLLDMPQPVHWAFLHEACDPDVGRDSDYHFSVERVRTAGDVLSHSAHLLETKPWLVDTDWHLVMARAAAQIDH